MTPVIKLSKAERNIKEKKRRLQMKDLYANLADLLPDPQSNKLSVAEILKEATSYIQQLQRNGELLERKKALLKGDDDIDHKTSNIIGSSSNLPIINFTTSDSILEVNLVSALNKNFMLYEIINVLLEEGAEVVHAAHTNAGDKSIYVVKSKAISSRIGVETSRVEERLKELIF
ncbi:hypothetical protein LWI29_019510 [Acer saccharum]|uniref:BHLH domain-containing protein n=1 Tax=Acer saccharum TaxID=4024 RepID=A0AA39VRI6_ACESA|nr:hypothetical protein LWI29_019510 [Acer saccharum]KAK1567751.1 hypothetical protein Q3G72_016178 [Acer saccharum]